MKKIILLFLFLYLFSKNVIAQESIPNFSNNNLNAINVDQMEGGVNSFFKKIGLGINWKFTTVISEQTALRTIRNMRVVLNWFRFKGRSLINFWLRIWSTLFRVKYVPLDINFPDVDSYPPGYLTPTPIPNRQCKDSDGDNRYKQGLVTSGKNNLCRGSACFDGCYRQWSRTKGFVSYTSEWICVDDQPEEILLECPGSCLTGHCIEP
jgi:hypothetical protein